MKGFGKFSKKRESIGKVVSLNEELIHIDPPCDGFFDNILKSAMSKNKDIADFIEAVKEVKAAKISDFWKPIYDPSIEDGKVVFKAGNVPAVGYSFNEWKNFVSEISPIAGKQWKIGTEYQYYAFLVWLINKLVENGVSLGKSIEAVVLNSKDLGHYSNSDKNNPEFEKTGSRNVFGNYDLANTSKLLDSSNDKSIFWFAGGYRDDDSFDFPLAELNFSSAFDYSCRYSVAWIVLE